MLEVTEPMVALGPTKLEMQVDTRRWRQVRAVCRRLAGRELSDVECFMMVTEHYLMKLGLHTREPHPQSFRKKYTSTPVTDT